MDQYILAALLGIVEGLTEFLPVSSTGHLILLVDLLHFKAPEGRSFEVMIQFGAILAVIIAFRRKLWEITTHQFSDIRARRFALAIFLAVLPALFLGALFGERIKAFFFSPFVVGITLLMGGFVLLVADKVTSKTPVHDVEDVPVWTAFKIGVIQCIAMIPGVSRSGATIVGGRIFGLDRVTAAQFSFFLAIPTMLAAFVYQAWKLRNDMSSNDFELIAIGFIFAFISGLFVVRVFLTIVAKMGFAPFAYYRMALGALVLVLTFS